MESIERCTLCETGFSFMSGNEKHFSRGHYINHNMINSFIKERNKYSVFCSAYSYDSTDINNANLYGDLYLDFDSPDDFQKAREDAITALSYFKVCYKIPENIINIYFSGSKGIHITVPAIILGIEPTHFLNGVFKFIANSIKTYTKYKTIDTQIYDNKRLFRIPNTIHEKSMLYKIPISPEELHNLSESQIHAIATSPRVWIYKPVEVSPYAKKQFERMTEEYQAYAKEIYKDRKYKRILTFTPPCIQHILDNGAVEGQRNITIACLAGFYKSSGKSIKETIDLIDEWNSKNIKPTGMQELKKTISSIFNSSKQFGCSTLKGISICEPAKCRLSKKG